MPGDARIRNEPKFYDLNSNNDAHKYLKLFEVSWNLQRVFLQCAQLKVSTLNKDYIIFDILFAILLNANKKQFVQFVKWKFRRLNILLNKQQLRFLYRC